MSCIILPVSPTQLRRQDSPTKSLWEAEPTITEVNQDTSKRIEISLKHSYLPKLEAAGLRSVSPNAGRFELDEMDDIAPFLDTAARKDGLNQVALATD